MREQLSKSENVLEVITSIETLKEELPWEERGHGHPHNLICVLLTEEQGNNKICAYYRIGNKYKQSFDQIKNDYDIKYYVKTTMWLNAHTENDT